MIFQNYYYEGFPLLGMRSINCFLQVGRYSYFKRDSVEFSAEIFLYAKTKSYGQLIRLEINSLLFALRALEWSSGNQVPLKGTRQLPRDDLSGSRRDSFGTETFTFSLTYMAFMNSKDLKEHSIAFSSVSTYSAPNEVVAIMSSSTAILTSCPSITNLIFQCKMDGTAPAMWIHGLPSKQLQEGDISIT